MGLPRRIRDDRNVLIPDAMMKDAKKGMDMVEALVRIMPAAGRPDKEIVRDLLLIGRMNGDLYETKAAKAQGVRLDVDPIRAALYALYWIEGQLNWFDTLHVMYRMAGYSAENFLENYRMHMDKHPKLDRIRVEDGRILEALDGLHGRVNAINKRLETVLYNVRRMRDGGDYSV